MTSGVPRAVASRSSMSELLIAPVPEGPARRGRAASQLPRERGMRFRLRTTRLQSRIHPREVIQLRSANTSCSPNARDRGLQGIIAPAASPRNRGCLSDRYRFGRDFRSWTTAAIAGGLGRRRRSDAARATPGERATWAGGCSRARRGGDDDGDGGAANAKAKRELTWQPSHPSWRQGFAT